MLIRKGPLTLDLSLFPSTKLYVWSGKSSATIWMARDLNGGHFAAVVPSLFKNGFGYGACFQVCIYKSIIMSNQILYILVMTYKQF